MDANAVQPKLLGLIYEYFEANIAWPPHAYIEPRLDRETQADLDEVLQQMPAGLVEWSPSSPEPELALSVRGLLACPGDGPQTDLVFFLRAVQWLTDRQQRYLPPAGPETPPLNVTRDELRVGLIDAGIGPGEGHMGRLFLLFRQDPNLWTGLGGNPNEEWNLTVSRRIRRYRGVTSIEDYLKRREDSVPSSTRTGAADSQTVPEKGKPMSMTTDLPRYERLLLTATDIQGDTPIQPVPQRSESELMGWVGDEGIDRGALLAALTELERRGWMDLIKVMGPWHWQVTYAGFDAAASIRLSSQASATEEESAVKEHKDLRAVFVIHGRDETARKAMFDFLRAIDLKPLEWSELVASTGEGAPYVGQVLDAAFKQAQAVLVLMTPDDIGRLASRLQKASDPSAEKELTPQARLNVVFEAGMALATHPKRTVLVELGRLRPYSDLSGRHAIHLDNSAEKKTDVVERLKTAGCAVLAEGRRDWLSVTFPEDYPVEPDQRS